MSDAAVSTNKIAAPKWVAAFMLAFFVLLMAVKFIHGDELVDHVPLPYQLVWAAIGFAVGAYAVVKLRGGLNQPTLRGYVPVVGAPLIMIVLATYIGRLAYEVIGFASITPTEMRVDAPVIGMSSGRSGRHAIVAIGSGSREIWVSVTGDLYDRLDAHRYPGRDCLILAIETGRYGIKRAILPGWLEKSVDVDRMELCPPPNYSL